MFAYHTIEKPWKESTYDDIFRQINHTDMDTQIFIWYKELAATN